MRPVFDMMFRRHAAVEEECLVGLRRRVSILRRMRTWRSDRRERGMRRVERQIATLIEGNTVEYLKIRPTRGQARSVRLRGVLACAGALALVACTTVQPPAPEPPPVARPVTPPPIIIVQPVKPEPPLAVSAPVLESPKVNEEAEEALALLVELQRLVQASADEQKRELAAATQALTRQKSDTIRLRLGMLQSLSAAGGEDARALATLEPIVKQGSGPARMVAAVLIAQLGERQRAVREEKKRAEDLQQKLDALKALERSLLGRERKPTGAP